jgi:hypothetical protein
LKTNIYLTIDSHMGNEWNFRTWTTKTTTTEIIQSIQFNFHRCCQRYAKYSNQLSASTPRNKNTQTYWSCMMDQVLFTEEFTQQPRRKTTHSSAGDVVLCCVESCQIKT